MKPRTRKFIDKIKIYIAPFANWKFLISFGLGWIITNGWSYLFLFFGTVFHINWMVITATAYISFLWLPFTAEKIVTISLAVLFQTLFFPRDLLLKCNLLLLRFEAKRDFNKVKEKIKNLFRKKKD